VKRARGTHSCETGQEVPYHPIMWKWGERGTLPCRKGTLSCGNKQEVPCHLEMDKRYTWLTSAVCISLAIFVFLAVGELLADAISANICKQDH